VFLAHGAEGDRIQVPLEVPGDESYQLVLYLTGGPGHGSAAISLDEKPLGEAAAARPEFTPWFPTELGPLRLSGGRHQLTLEMRGGPAGTKDLALGLVSVQLKPHSRFIDRWSVVGNWPCPRDGGWAKAWGPEESQDLAAAYPVPGGQDARWREHQGEGVGLGGGDYLVAYGLTYIHSPDDRAIACFIGKDDGLKVWVNNEVAFDQNTWSHATPDQFYCGMKLKAGWNKVLVKCANLNGGWGFSLRPSDPDRKLRFARQPE
jgi:hypothetical protein